MRHLILNGQLDVMVFNKRLQPEARKLGLIQHTRRMQILREDGSCEDSWDVDHLQCISFGIASSILPQPPPAEKTLSFRFHFQTLGVKFSFNRIVLRCFKVIISWYLVFWCFVYYVHEPSYHPKIWSVSSQKASEEIRQWGPISLCNVCRWH